MDYFNWVDAAIILIMLTGCWQGTCTGLINSVFQILAIVTGLFAASTLYASGGNLLGRYLHLPQSLCDLASFILIFLASAALVAAIGALFRALTRFRFIKIADKIGGSISGLVIGAVIVGIALILLTSFPLFGGFQAHIEQSRLAPEMLKTAHYLHEKVGDILPAKMPRLAFHPEQLAGYFERSGPESDHKFIDFSSLDQATCMVCEGQVAFLGYLVNSYNTVSPKFQCANCGRTSDGCQTFEGHHLMYEQCPVALGRQGYRFDCGIWPNGSYHRPVGTCPVCGEKG